MGHGCHDCGCPNGCTCDRPTPNLGVDLSKLIQAVNNDPEVVLAELDFKKAERHLEAARADLRSRRQIADKRHRARLLLEQRKAEIAQLEAEVESTYDRSTEGQR